MLQTLSKQKNMSVRYCHNHKMKSNKIFGFWIYLMSDCILFATLFATYMVMVNNTAGGPDKREFFNLPLILIETILLLLSSIACGISSSFLDSGNKYIVNGWLTLSFLFGFSFITIEIYEFYHLILQGYRPDRSGFLSSFFSLVGMHGLHVISGLLWMILLIFQIEKDGLTSINCTRVICLNLFWHFLDIIWICLFTIVYLIGAIQ